MLSNAPIWILVTLAPDIWFKEHILFVLLIFYLVSMSGSILSSYLIARKTEERYFRVGIGVGIFAYCIYALSMSLLGVGGGILELPPFIGFIIGGIIGARYYEITKTKR